MFLSAKEKQFYDPILKAQTAQGSLNIKGMDILCYQYFLKTLTKGVHLFVTEEHYNFHKNEPKRGSMPDKSKP